MERRKSAYVHSPGSIVYKGHRYVLAADGAEDEVEEKDTEKEEEKPKESKKRGPKTTRVNIDECRGEGVYFDIEMIVSSQDGAGIPGLSNADAGVRSRELKIKKINKLKDVPEETLRRIEDAKDGKDLLERLDKLLQRAQASTLYFISAKGGWSWSAKNGDRDVSMIQGLLDFMRSKKSALYTYCNNGAIYGNRKGLL